MKRSLLFIMLVVPACVICGVALADDIDRDITVHQTQLETMEARFVVHSFSANPNPVERGGTITLNWEVSGGTNLQIMRLIEARGGSWVETIGHNLPASGSLIYTIPPDYINFIPFILTSDQMPTGYEIVVDILCPYTNILAEICPITQQTVSAAYQPFEGGFMVCQ
jgi:hypothetical protein